MRHDFEGTERFDPSRHETGEFRSGNEMLDRWLVRCAGRGERRDAARTFVVAGSGANVIAYYTLVAGVAKLRMGRVL